MKIFVPLVLVISFALGSLTDIGLDKRDLNVLKSLDINENFLKEPVFISMKNSILNKRKSLFLKKLNDAYTFVPIIKDMITEAGIPEAFLYLAMAESNFSIRAYSKKRASGLWQFMPATAKGFGLKIDNYTDERRDPIKSTKIAIKYLKHLHNRFGKWYLAALAYNCGEGRLARGIKQAKSDDLNILLDSKKKYLPKESRLYIRKILSLAFMANSINFLFLDDFEHLLNRGSIYPISPVSLKGGTHLSDIARSIKMSVKELKKLNRHLKYNFLPPYAKEYQIYIPYNRLALFKANFRQTDIKFLMHVVEQGDSLYKIGKKYKIDYELIKEANSLKKNFLSLDKKLLIPIPLKNKSVKRVKKSLYIIKRGDTLSEIAKIFDTPVKNIKEANNLKSNFIKIGDKIVIPN